MPFGKPRLGPELEMPVGSLGLPKKPYTPAKRSTRSWTGANSACCDRSRIRTPGLHTGWPPARATRAAGNIEFNGLGADAF